MKKTLALALALVASGCGASQAPYASYAGSMGYGALAHARTTSGPLSLIVEPDMGVQPLLDAINSAKKSIKVEIYMFTDHNQTAQLVQALCAKAQAGVAVQVLYEDKPYIPPSPPNCSQPPDPTQVNAPAIQALTAAGVQCKQSDPRFVFTHQKSMLIDDTTAYVMTLNLSGSAFTVNREYIVSTQLPQDVAEVGAIFDADWNQQPFTPQDPNLVVSPDNSRAKLLSLINSAQHSLILESEYMTDPQILAALGARVKAGVKIQVMLSFQPVDPCTGDNMNADELKLCQAQGLTQVVFTQKVTMHAKSIMVDGQAAYVGSENMTKNSLDGNRELGIIVRDPVIVGTLVNTATHDFANR